jgi:polyhydroxyalkanoate synthase
MAEPPSHEVGRRPRRRRHPADDLTNDDGGAVTGPAPGADGAALLMASGLEILDELRRGAGWVLDALGHGPRTTRSGTTSPTPGVRLHHYPAADPSGPPVLLVPAPIKRCYIFDIDPRRSVVARCLRHGLQPHLVEWTDPGPQGQRLGLDAYVDLLGRCLRIAADHTGAARIPLVGHSLGGTLAAIYASRYPDLVGGLALLEAPLHFGPDAGALAAQLAAADPVALDTFPNGVPGSLLTLGAGAAAPAEFQLDRWIDLLGCLADPDALATYLRVLRWTLDEFREPRQLFADVVEHLYGHDRFATGTLSIGGRTTGPAGLVAPVLTVVNPRSGIVPPAAVLPVHDAFAATDKRVLPYTGDTGVVVQHLGVLVGRNAHRVLWQRILAWLDTVTADQAASAPVAARART